MATIFIPAWFYGLHAIMHFVSAIFGYFVAFYAYKLYDTTGKKSHQLLYLAFALLSTGLLILAVTSGYVFLNFWTQQIDITSDFIFDISDLGYWLYFIASLISYALLAIIYSGERVKLQYLPAAVPLSFLPISIPFWYSFYLHFNVISLFLMAYVTFRAAVNWKLSGSKNALYVLVAFASISLYHLFVILSQFKGSLDIIGNGLMVVGFLSLILMLRNVTRKRVTA